MPGIGDLLGALGTVGGRGVAGATEGVLEGNILKRRFESEDALNSLRMLDTMFKQQQLQQSQRPQTELHNGVLYQRDPMRGTLVPMGAAPQAPPTERDLAAIDASRAAADLHRRQAGEVGKPKAAPEPQLPAEFRMALDEWKRNPANQGRSILDFQREYSAAKQAPERPYVGVSHQTDAQGNVREIVTTFNAATGKYDTQVRNLGPIGKPERPEKPSEQEKAISDYLGANKLPNTPENRLKARAASGESKVDLQMMRGGPWIDKSRSGVKVVDNLTRGEWNADGGHERYQKIPQQALLAAQLIESQGFPAIEQLKNLAPLVLAKARGANLFQLGANKVESRLSGSNIREFEQAATTLAYEISRAMGGSSAIRKFMSEMLRSTEVPNPGDRVITANRMLENSRTVLMNYIREAKGLKPFSYPSLARTVEAISPKGEEVKVKLAPYEPLPAGYGWRY